MDKAKLAKLVEVSKTIGRLELTLEKSTPDELGTRGPSLIKAKIEELTRMLNGIIEELTGEL